MHRHELRQRNPRVGDVQAADSGADTGTDNLFVEDEDDDDDDDENASEKEDRCEKSVLEGQGRREGEGSPAKSVPDMYKAFDGSALMAIGMPRH